MDEEGFMENVFEQNGYIVRLYLFLGEGLGG
jgi:hypothetical protein